MVTDYRPALEAHPRGTCVAVWVVPGASRSGIAGLHGGAVKLRVSVPAERGRANQAAAAMLEAALGTKVGLLSGGTSRRKRFLVPGLGVDDVAAALDAAPHP